MTIVLHEKMTPEQINAELISLYSKTTNWRSEELKGIKSRRKKIRKQLFWAFDLSGKSPLELQKERRDE